MGRYTNILSHLLDEAGPRNAWGFWADFAIILYAMQDDVLQAADQSEQWAELVCTCVRQIHDFPIDHWEPQKNISKGCVVIVRKILQDLPEDRQVFRQNTAALLDELLQQMIDRKYIVDLITPLSLADLMAAMVVPQEPCRILDPVCGSGRLLLAARRVNPAANLLGFEISESISAAARLRLGMEENGNSDVEQTDFFLKTPYLEQRFDVILAKLYNQGTMTFYAHENVENLGVYIFSCSFTRALICGKIIINDVVSVQPQKEIEMKTTDINKVRYTNRWRIVYGICNN